LRKGSKNELLLVEWNANARVGHRKVEGDLILDVPLDRDSDDHLALFGEFDRVTDQITTICRRRPGSPINPSGTTAGM